MVIAFDLDDTLCPEMEFVRSSYREIARIYGLHLLPAMYAAATTAAAFDSTGLPEEIFLPLYRYHFPDISLPMPSLYTLAALRNSGHTLALVTDGREATQQNKIEALRLKRFMAPDNIFVSEQCGHPKTDGYAFRTLMQRYPSAGYMYVGDNPEKDFRTPRSLGWITVCLLDSGRNIHPQHLKGVEEASLPNLMIKSLYELPDLVI